VSMIENNQTWVNQYKSNNQSFLFGHHATMARKIYLGELWPSGNDDLSAIELRKLDNRSFSYLKRLYFDRELRSTGSRASAKRLARTLELKRRGKKHVEVPKSALLARCQESEILDALVPDRKSIWRTIGKRSRYTNISLHNFSFLDYPIETTKQLAQIAKAECDSLNFTIDFNDKYVLDIAPYLVLGVMRENMAEVSSGGIISAPTQKVLEALGVREFLRMRTFGNVPIDEVWPLPLHQRRKSGTSTSSNIATQPTTVEIVGDQSTKHVHAWLGKLNPPSGLTNFGATRLKACICEILDNAQRHGREGGDGEWIATGFMARREIDVDSIPQKMHICHMSFFNPGQSISASIVRAPAETIDQVKKYIAMHRAYGLSEQTLATVFALQDGISCVPQGNGQSSGGTGIMDVIEFTNNVGKTHLSGIQPKVAIISGRAYISLDHPYSTGVSAKGGKRRLQWFNSQNSAREPPSGTHVKDMPIDFPGTIITMRFVIDDELQTGNKKNDE